MNQSPATQIQDQVWFDLSAAQRANWFHYQLDPGSQGNLNNTFAARLHGPVDATRIRAALQSIVDRHPMLRACFSAPHGTPQQTISPSATLILTEIDVSGLDSDALKQRIVQDCRQPFVLANSPLIRASIYWLQPREAVLVVVSDHIIVDGWSYWQILQELENALSAPDQIIPTVETADYASYIAWQNQWLDSTEGKAQLMYWRNNLSGELPVLQLPLDRPRPAHSSGVQEQVGITLSTATTERLHAMAKQQACTLYTILLSAYQILLHRHTGQDDIIVGSPLPARPHAKWDRVVGDFVNPVSLRTAFSEGQTARDLLRQVRGTTLRAMANQEYPFSLLVERLQPVRVTGEHPIFQSTFVLHRATHGSSLLGLPESITLARPSVNWGEIRAEAFPVRQSGNIKHIALELEAIEVDGYIICAFKYDVDLFDAATVRRLAGHFESILEGMLTDPGQEISRLNLLGEQERCQILQEFNITGEPYRPQRLLHELFEQHAAKQPDAIAVACEGQALSYAELNLRANRLAHELISQGVKPEQRVAICMERSLGLLVGIIGILKSGAAYVPLDPTYPVERMAYMLSDCAPMALVTQSSLQSRLPKSALPLKLLSSGGELAGGGVAAHDLNPDPQALGLKPHHLAYTIYTSGSTGMPKGVMIEHGNVPRIFGSAQPWFGFNEHDTWSMFHSSAFDFSVWEIWGALLHGGKLVIVPSEVARSPTDFYSLLCREKVTVLSQTPGAFRQLLGTQEEAGLSHSLRKIIFAGEALELHSMSRWFERNDPDATALINMYGATESTVHATFKHITPADVAAQLRGCCGKPIPGYGIYILDKHQQPVPFGVAGEIYIGGPCVARGYMNRPELNAERFIPNHLSGEPGGRLYKTGDMGRWLPEGGFDYLGRNDFQVKIRGFRIELGEIEAKLGACRGVLDVVVIAREDQPGDKRLVAYLVPVEGTAITLPDLRRELSRTLPEYMVPSAFVMLERLPLTPNGKLDRKALPAPDSTAVVASAYVAPMTPIEAKVAGIWQTILGLEQIGRNDNFFELGGHSLLAIQLMLRLRESFEVDLPLKSLFEHPVLADLATIISAAQLARYASEEVQVLEAELEGLSEEELRAMLTSQA